MFVLVAYQIVKIVLILIYARYVKLIILGYPLYNNAFIIVIAVLDNFLIKQLGFYFILFNNFMFFF